MEEHSNKKYIIHVYKIVSRSDDITLFISSTKAKIKSILPFVISDSNKSTTKNVLYNWFTKYPENSFSCKKIKSYPVSNKEEQDEKEDYWIKKYKQDGYNVLHNLKKKEKEVTKQIQNSEKLYVCFQGVSMEEIMTKYKNNIVTISKEPLEHKFQCQIPPQIPPPPPNKSFNINKQNYTRPLSGTIKKETHVSTLSSTSTSSTSSTSTSSTSTTSSTGYLDELRNILQLRKTSGKPISELQKKINVKIKKNKILNKVSKIISPSNNQKCGQTVLDELKKKN